MFYFYQIVKFFAWEKSFEQRILAVRELELKKLLYSGYIMTLLTFSWTAAPFLVSGKTGQDGRLCFLFFHLFVIFSPCFSFILCPLSHSGWLSLSSFLSPLSCCLSLPLLIIVYFLVSSPPSISHLTFVMHIFDNIVIFI